MGRPRAQAVCTWDTSSVALKKLTKLHPLPEMIIEHRKISANIRFAARSGSNGITKGTKRLRPTGDLDDDDNDDDAADGSAAHDEAAGEAEGILGGCEIRRDELAEAEAAAMASSQVMLPS